MEGAGDRQVYSGADSDSIPCRHVTGRLQSRYSIPVYTMHEATRYQKDCGVYDDHTKTIKLERNSNEMAPRVPPPLRSAVDILSEYFCCPICNDPCIETTATNCGHKFCRQCIDEWRTNQPVCPICSTLITSRHRLYSDDQFVESQLGYLRPELKRRFQDAQSKRVQALIEEGKSRNVIKSVRKSLNKSLDYLRCKQSKMIGNKMHSVSQFCFDCSKRFNYGFLASMLAGALFVLGFQYLEDQTQFLHYLWLAMKNYKGKIPTNFPSIVSQPSTEKIMIFTAASTNATDERSVFDIVVGFTDNITSKLYSLVI